MRHVLKGIPKLLTLQIEKVEAMKDLEREQQEIVKKYLQHRKMLRQTENSMARAALDTKMLQTASDQHYEVGISLFVYFKLTQKSGFHLC